MADQTVGLVFVLLGCALWLLVAIGDVPATRVSEGSASGSVIVYVMIGALIVITGTIWYLQSPNSEEEKGNLDGLE